MASRAIVLSHRGVADELGHIGEWLSDSGMSIDRMYREDDPKIPDGDLLVVLGSPNSVASGHCLPPAQAEIEAVRAWVAADRPYVGVCFGAQVLARAFGGSVSRMERTYRDYIDFETVQGAPSVLEGRWAVWHEDAITAPSGADVLARLPHADTVFRIGRAWGLQPHVEFDATIVRNLGDVVGIPEEQWLPLHRALSDDDAGHASRSRALLDHIAAEIL
jgi:GMP synthase-like glutamine amidotransferase